MPLTETQARALCAEYGQDHLFQCWETLSAAERESLLTEISEIDFPLMRHLTETWVFQEPAAEHFTRIDPVPVIPKATHEREDARQAWAAGEEALRAGRVGLFLVAGGQGTRLGFEGPKGAYPIGPVSKKSLFEFHAEKIQNLRRRYGCILPWYIMVSEENGPDTRAFFEQHGYFGLGKENVQFLTQRMVPCIAADGKFMLETPSHLARNPNGHGGSIPAMVECNVLDDARKRGVDLLCYFQVDNWAVKVADPYFIGYHVLRNAAMSSKNHRKRQPREAVGVHCLCDGEYRVVEYSELDIYPQLLQTDSDGNVIYYAGNPAIHILSVDFIQQVYDKFSEFPWHRAHKKVPYLDPSGTLIRPEDPNAYKFETFVFDALRYCSDCTVALEIEAPGEYTPIKSFSGDNSVESAWEVMRNYWAGWLAAAGVPVPRDREGRIGIQIEISPQFALSQEEFLDKVQGIRWPEAGDIALDKDGNWITPESR